ncbi:MULTISPECIES: RNA polymerase sigma factor [unclassified Rhizobium]|uniref:RNA polymerase sigma factor n=1 Tax=unclassified Rhizobium TaxID=2613769 RepID=UPI001A9970DC|nr:MULTISPECIES: RNA polymerase sigma factor [unclassified Rhizobium]MBX5159952.1 RNA polymerase sigma factor [Rhizobium sp. NZLR8]MBX5166123.1 RNA polymerase sigma factor [Rhizobium sp. NZLR4b]MBX5170308.1 RNA polymerase sigma factor [Rhizobium sp. NZLR1b]MBX5185731.1 RNA polymerase sigma factor [Rhizobium sp. NZLR5]MBX5189970.1 RNA polymerase sigma factor [Rhizobium sp. NZLR3b]
MRQPATTIDLRRDLVGLLPRLRRFAITLAGEAAVADELVQAVCQRAITKGNQWSGEGRLESWIYTLARQQWTDDSRKRKPKASVRGNVTDIREAARERSAGADPDGIHHMIADMPDGLSSMFLLVDVEGHSYQQAADIMGTPVANVVSQLATARLHFAGLAGTHPIHRY